MENKQVINLDWHLAQQEYRCACGSRRDGEDTGLCRDGGYECSEPCAAAIESFLEDLPWWRRQIMRLLSAVGRNPYRGLERKCPEYRDAVACPSCGEIYEV